MTTRELLERHPTEWAAATNGPFLDAVREGSLLDSAFQRWLVQDYRFVSDLLSFQARLLSVAPRSGQAALAAGLVGLEAELVWFESYSTRLGLRLDVDRHPTTAAYCRLLRSVADSWPEGITALWTGERAYLEAWRSVSDAPHHRDFVLHWTQPEFVRYVADLGAVVDAAGAGEAAFLAVCVMERDFWSMAWDSAAS
ncbi:MAG: TenA family transcriptional regulator [Candidatus Dormibacterales bacterium]